MPWELKLNNKTNKGHYIEAIDRAHTVAVMIEQLLWEHPAIVKAELQSDVEKLVKLTYDVYNRLNQQEEKFDELET